MARQKKSIPIDRVTDNTGRTVEILYNPNEGKNFHEAEVAGEIFQHLALAEVKAWVIKRLKETVSLTWTPVIVVTIDSPGIMVNISRIRLADTGGKRYRYAGWSTPEEFWLSSSAFNHDLEPGTEFPCKVETRYGGRSARTIVYLLYSEKHYNKLVKFFEYLDIARETFKERLMQEDGIDVLLPESILEVFAI